jgi:adenylosuccinate synthase
VTRLDVLSGFDEVKLCSAYDLRGREVRWLPSDARTADLVKPIYETLSGWSGDISSARSLKDLPPSAQEFLRRIEEYTGVPISLVSVGPGREQTIAIRENLLWKKEPASAR